MMAMWAKSLLLSAFAALGAAAPVDASPRPQIHPAWVLPVQERGERQRELRPIREVIEELRARHGGEFLGYHLENGARPIYVIRWRMPDGVTTREFRVNAAR